MQKMWVWSLGRENALEESMATHFSILAWEIMWTEELGRLQSMGLAKYSDTTEHPRTGILIPTNWFLGIFIISEIHYQNEQKS